MSNEVSADPIYSEEELLEFNKGLQSARKQTVNTDDEWFDDVKQSWKRGGKLVLGVTPRMNDELIGGAILQQHDSQFRDTVEVELLYHKDLIEYEDLGYGDIVDSIVKYSTNTCRKYGYEKLLIYLEEKEPLKDLLSNLINENGFTASNSQVDTADGIICLEKEVDEGYTKDVYDSAEIIKWLTRKWGIEVDRDWSPDDNEPLLGKITVDRRCSISIPVQVYTSEDVIEDRTSYNIRIDRTGDCESSGEYECSVTINQVRDITHAHVYINHTNPRCVAVEIDKDNFEKFDPITVGPYIDDDDMDYLSSCEEKMKLDEQDAIYLDGGEYGHLLPNDDTSRGYTLFLKGNTKDMVLYGIGNIKSIIHGYDKICEEISDKGLITSFRTIHPVPRDMLDVYRNIKTKMTGFVIDVIQEMEVDPSINDEVTGIGHRDFRTPDDKYRKHGYRYISKEAFDDFVDACENEFRLPELIN
jgi:hypothetical protein